MESYDPAVLSSIDRTTTIAPRVFSKTIAVTYAGLGLVGLIFLIGTGIDLQ